MNAKHFTITLDGTVALEDSILLKGFPAEAGSQILSGFTAPFDACAVERLKNAGYKPAGKTVMAEFGIGDLEPDTPDAMAGAVGCVADGDCAFALANDFSGRYRRQAARNGVCYIHPTYGTVSRYGLIPSVSSMDQIGVVCKSVGEGFAALSVISGYDPRDGACLPHERYEYAPKTGGIRVGYPKNALDIADSPHRDAVTGFGEILGAKAFDALDYFDVYAQVMYILSSAEICNNISRYDGVKFGYRAREFAGVNGMYLATRTQGLGFGSKLAAIMGSMVLSKACYEGLYHKSMQLRGLIQKSLNALFETYDVILLPSASGGASDPYAESALYAAAVLAGLPCVSVPHGGAGVQLLARAGGENALFAACEMGGLA